MNNACVVDGLVFPWSDHLSLHPTPAPRPSAASPRTPVSQKPWTEVNKRASFVNARAALRLLVVKHVTIRDALQHFVSFSLSPSLSFLLLLAAPPLLFPVPSIFFSRKLVRGIHARTRGGSTLPLVVYFLRYIKPYILWDIRSSSAVPYGGGIRLLTVLTGAAWAAGDEEQGVGCREDTRITLRERASD